MGFSDQEVSSSDSSSEDKLEENSFNNRILFSNMVIVNTDNEDDKRVEYDWAYVVTQECESDAEESNSSNRPCRAAPGPST